MNSSAMPCSIFVKHSQFTFLFFFVLSIVKILQLKQKIKAYEEKNAVLGASQVSSQNEAEVKR